MRRFRLGLNKRDSDRKSSKIRIEKMHMANELLSLPVAAGTFGIAASGVGIICRKIKNSLTPEKLPLMGVLGGFVFAAQMVNFQLPFMPGTSGHMVGSVLLSIILGPAAAVIVMTSIVIVQCLVFQDGGLLALGCNTINMAIVPCFAGYYLYKVINSLPLGKFRMQAACIFASIIAVEIGASLVPIQAALSGVLLVPFKTFLFTMIGVHLLIGTVEGILTWAVLSFLLCFVPVVGNLLALAPPSAMALLEFGWPRAAAVVIGYIVINNVIDYAVRPRFLKHGVSLSPLVIVLSLLFWGSVLGPVGVVVAVPLTLLLRKLILEHFRETRTLAAMMGPPTASASAVPATTATR
jgi:cobalamin biosynthesis protein CbiM